MENKDFQGEKYILVDFGASQTHTHHKQSLFAFANLLDRSSVSNEIWVPFGSSINSRNYSIKRRLIPGSHANSFSIKNVKTWMPGIFGGLFHLSTKINSKFLFRIHVFIVVYVFYIFIKRESRDKSINVVFTTSCPFSLNTIPFLEKRKLKLHIFVRLTNTAESRYQLFTKDRLKEIICNSQTFKYSKTKFATESTQYLNSLNLKENILIYISQFPPEIYEEKASVLEDKFVVSFLGMPSSNKGSHLVPEIIISLVNLNPKINFQVHLKSKENIDRFDVIDTKNIKFLFGKIGEEEMYSALKGSTIICLPYELAAYKLNASAMLYQAMDHLIPVISFNQLAFSSDINKFNCGICVDNLPKMISVISKLTSDEVFRLKKGCIAYNEYRNFSNLTFLDLVH